MMKKAAGFSLIELMMVIGISAILVAVALPAYNGYVQRSNRTVAHSTLGDVALRLERWYLQNNSYTADLAALGFASDPFTTADGNYTITLNLLGGSNQAFQATATVVASSTQSGDTDCTSFSVDHRGTRTATGGATTPNDECW